jgi:hypothetical protein
VIKRLLGSYKFAAGNWANRCPTGMFRPRENEFTKGPDSAAKEYFFGRRWRTSPSFEGSLHCRLGRRGGTPPSLKWVRLAKSFVKNWGADRGSPRKLPPDATVQFKLNRPHWRLADRCKPLSYGVVDMAR